MSICLIPTPYHPPTKEQTKPKQQQNQKENKTSLPFKAAGTDLGVVKIYSWERGPSPASLHAWIQNLYDVDSLSLCTLYVWHGPLYKDTNLKMERVAYSQYRK